MATDKEQKEFTIVRNTYEVRCKACGGKPKTLGFSTKCRDCGGTKFDVIQIKRKV